MKIVFICSSLEPGKDGVGDYTRRLGAELIKRGHSIKIIALNDCFICEIDGNTQKTDRLKVPVLRLPSTWAMDKKLVLAKAYIHDFDPDWLSLQFVIFGFHPKGLAFGFGRDLAILGEGRRWHIMFHEIWVGVNKHRYALANAIWLCIPMTVLFILQFYSPQSACTYGTTSFYSVVGCFVYYFGCLQKIHFKCIINRCVYRPTAVYSFFY